MWLLVLKVLSAPLSVLHGCVCVCSESGEETASKPKAKDAPKTGEGSAGTESTSRSDGKSFYLTMLRSVRDEWILHHATLSQKGLKGLNVWTPRICGDCRFCYIEYGVVLGCFSHFHVVLIWVKSFKCFFLVASANCSSWPCSHAVCASVCVMCVS